MAFNTPFGTYLFPKGGTPIFFDCVVSEQVVRDAEITEFPVEVGANITDHYRVKTNEVKLEVFISQEPINHLMHPEGDPYWGAQVLTTPEYPSQGLLTSLAKVAVNPVGTLMNAVGGLLSDSTNPFTQSPVLLWRTPFDPLATILEKLDALRAQATLIDIFTRSAAYQGFVLGNVTTMRSKETGTGTKIALDLKRIVTVSTQKVIAPKPVFPKDAPPVNKGVQTPTDPGDKQSLASSILGLFGG